MVSVQFTKFRAGLRAFSLCALTLAIALLVSDLAITQGRRGERLQTIRVDGREAIAGEVLVSYRDPQATIERARAEFDVDADEVEMVSRRGLRRMHSRRLGTQALLARLRANPDVEFAEPNYVIHVDALPNDASFGSLWGLWNTGQVVSGVTGIAGVDIGAVAAWNFTTGSRANVVAVVDTGVDYLHPDLIANMWSAPTPFSVTIGGVLITCPAGSHGFNAINNTCDPMDDHNHGTHVSGTIGAVGNNGIGVAGVNWIASIMGAKFLGASGSGTTANAIKAIEFAIQTKAVFAGSGGANVRVLSNSWGGIGFSQALLDEINRANTNDMLFVAAAGNDAVDNDSSAFRSYPAAYSAPNLISVAATDNRDRLASFSNYGRTSVHLGAPGVGVLSTIRHGADTCSTCHLASFNGTSMATPHVSGAAALLLSACTLTTAQLKSALLNNVDPVSALSLTTSTGGRLNVNQALMSCMPVVTADAVTPNTGSGLTQTFVTQFNDTAGASDLAVANVWFNTGTTTTVNSCLAYYARAGNTLNLMNDAGTGWLTGTMGSAATLQNSSCAVSLSGATATPSGNTLTLSLPVTFKTAFAGAKNIYLYGANGSGVRSGWQLRGSWTVPATIPVITADSATPNSGTGATQTFALQFTDTAGAADLAVSNVWFHTNSTSTANSCLAYYDRGAHTLNLLNDAGSSWIVGAMGTASTVQNSSCSIALGSATATPSGNTLTLSLPVTFKPAFNGVKNIYMYGGNTSGHRSGWQTRGTWTVPDLRTTPILTWATPANITHGTALNGTQLNATANVAGSFAYSPAAGTILGAGASQLLSTTFTPTDLISYRTASAIVALTVTRATPVVTWPTPASIAAGTPLSATQLNASANVPGTFAYSPAVGTVLSAGSGQTLSVTFTPSNTTNFAPVTTTRSITVFAAITMTADSATPSSGTGTTQTFALQYTHSVGATEIGVANVWFHTNTTSTANSCLAYYGRFDNSLNLMNDAGTGWLSGTMGSGGTLQNTSCRIPLSTATKTDNGTALTLSLSVAFSSTFAGAKNVYLYGADGSGNRSGWQARGTWTVPSGGGGTVITADSAAPTAGSGATQVFALQYGDSAGATDISVANVWFNTTTASTANSCLAYYGRADNSLNLLNDAGTAWLSGTMGAGGTLQNSSCLIPLGSATAVDSGTLLTLNLSVTFKPAFAGAKNIYMYGGNAFGVRSGWQARGTWTVPSSGGTVISADSATPNAGGGATQVFALQYTDSAGATDISVANVWFNTTTTSAANSCLAYYGRADNSLNLLNDSGTAWLSGTMGAGGTLQNSACLIPLGSATAVDGGTLLTLNLSVTFKPAFAGAKNIYLYGGNALGIRSGWQLRGTWTAP